MVMYSVELLEEMGLQALNAALFKLGCPPVGVSTDVRRLDPAITYVTHVLVDKPGVAPIKFIFGADFDVWIGPFCELTPPSRWTRATWT